MTRDEAIRALLAVDPAGGEVLYVERRADNYSWELLGEGQPMSPPGADHAEAWIYSSGPWTGHGVTRRFVEDLLDEMESMLGGADRCRWPLAEPWPEAWEVGGAGVAGGGPAGQSWPAHH